MPPEKERQGNDASGKVSMFREFQQYLRDLIIRRKIFLLLFTLSLLTIAVVSGSMYGVAARHLHEALQIRLKQIAATAALLVDGDLMDQIKTEDDTRGEAYQSIASKIREVRELNGLKFVYTLRRTPNPNVAVFVVDPSEKKRSPVGEEYALNGVPAMVVGFDKPSVDDEIIRDEFGYTLSGYAPVRRKDGSHAGLIGVDMDASVVAAARRQFLGAVVLASGLFLVFSLLTSSSFSRIITRPIYEMTTAVQSVSQGELSRRLPVRGRDELGQLSASINRMLETLSLYLPVKLVAQVLGGSGRLQLGGVKREVTVYFADLAGFTPISERLSPEELVALLNEYLTLMTDCIEATEGTVDKYIGDAVMAFWGAPVSQSDHAARACETALRQIDAIRPLQQRMLDQGRPPIAFRIGIHSGDVVVGNMGSSRRFNYTVMGDGVNLASRLEGANKNYGTTVLLSEETFRRVSDRFVCRKLDLLQVKGRKQAVAVYELVGRSGQVPAARCQAIEAFHDGLAAYLRRDWDHAEARFQTALAVAPGDAAARAFLSRVAAMRQSPPPADWDGVYEMKTK